MGRFWTLIGQSMFKMYVDNLYYRSLNSIFILLLYNSLNVILQIYNQYLQQRILTWQFLVHISVKRQNENVTKRPIVMNKYRDSLLFSPSLQPSRSYKRQLLRLLFSSESGVCQISNLPTFSTLVDELYSWWICWIFDLNRNEKFVATSRAGKMYTNVTSLFCVGSPAGARHYQDAPSRFRAKMQNTLMNYNRDYNQVSHPISTFYSSCAPNPA